MEYHIVNGRCECPDTQRKAPEGWCKHRLAQVWVGDITYLWPQEGWLYLAVLLDLYARKVAG